MAEQPMQGMLPFLYNICCDIDNWRTLFSGDKESCEQVMKDFGLTDEQIAAVHAVRNAEGDDRTAQINALDQQILAALASEIDVSFDSVW